MSEIFMFLKNANVLGHVALAILLENSKNIYMWLESPMFREELGNCGKVAPSPQKFTFYSSTLLEFQGLYFELQ